MKTAKEILQETITRYGLTVWEAHTDKMNRMIALEAMEKYADQVKSFNQPAELKQAVSRLAQMGGC